ncbi:MAG: HAD family hydrolase [Treponema sp.]|jgi:Cof subfamily protein (haloacid dehalogenase superfamily)|nr:HAD family hydrolase [Treponema sp.]
MKKIVFIDVDGTLVNEKMAAPESAQAACRTAVKNGHTLCLCSGRQRFLMEDLMGLGFQAVISAGGAEIEIERDVVFQRLFDDSLTRKITGFFMERETPFTLERSTGLVGSPFLFSWFDWLKAKEPHFAQYIDMYVKYEHVIRAEEGVFYGNAGKIVFGSIQPGFFDAVVAEFGGECDITRTSMAALYGNEGGEMTMKGLNKGSAVARVLEHYGLSKTDAIGIGDSDNDRAMLDACGIGVAMGNSKDDFKKIADFVTSDINDDGIEKAFKQYGLI